MIPWVGDNPYGFLIGDSLVEQCRPDFGMGWRSLGSIGWPGATTAMMRERLCATTEGWPFTSQPSNDTERVWFRDAGWLAFGLGTNDVKTLTAEQYAANVDWFLEQTHGRPTLWFTIHNPPFAERAAAFNAELVKATERWPNLRLLPWDAWANQNPDALLSDQVHVATYEYGCQLGRNRLIAHGAPAMDGNNAGPIGYWYEDGAKTGPVRINGWAAARLPAADSVVQVNVRADWQHVGRYPAVNDTADLYAQASGGRGFGIEIDAGFRGQLITLDLLDPAGQWTSLGSRKV